LKISIKKIEGVFMSYFELFFIRKTIILVILFLSTSTFALNAQQKIKNDENYKAIDLSGFKDSAHHWYDITDHEQFIYPLPGKPRYKPDEITKIADIIVLFQRNNGGWMKNYDMAAILTDKQKQIMLSTKDNDQTTFDNGTTYNQIIYLAKVYNITKIEKYKDAAIKGIEFVLKAQYPNGGWPQFYPDTSGYRQYITFNDNAMIGNMDMLHQILQKKPYFSFVDKSLTTKIESAFQKGIDCILKCQIKENGELTSWCQQHDQFNFQPRGARTFELPSISGEEGADVVLFLMSLEHPTNAIIHSVQSAVKWYNDHKLFGIKIKKISAPKVVFKFRTSSTDVVVVKDPKASPIWARFYELGTDRPLFSGRNSKPVYALADVERDRRDGYGWYTYEPQKILDEYPAWQKKWAPEKNLLR